ncbi:CGNR zinc finger domain-containing protein [Amycolatopsis sp. CA-230715]|uniref:CGNR zinc finger domain-containing protein n=1 Tax=Amycolatopsis sp. CA-230715 TaxID=2745196 RepID=UPI001C00CFBC|nr:CGNR zinc finger domain-containing protein [Amycolatopsis sp. CA-230715]
MSERPEHPDAALVIAFLNTLDVEEGTDALHSAESWQSWAAERGLTPGHLTGARSARAALRAAAGDPDSMPREASAAIEVRVDTDGPAFATTSATGAVLGAAARLAVLGLWDRVKICPADDCRWAFYDQSRNHSRTWCSMRVCGNREKARAWRERAAAEPT